MNDVIGQALSKLYVDEINIYTHATHIALFQILPWLYILRFLACWNSLFDVYIHAVLEVLKFHRH